MTGARSDTCWRRTFPSTVPLVPEPTGQPTLSLLVLRRVASDDSTTTCHHSVSYSQLFSRHLYSTTSSQPGERRSATGTFSCAGSRARSCCGPAANG